MAKDLSPTKCTLLYIHYASEGNIKLLRSLTAARPDDLKPELVLRILLTYLPESIEPREYTSYVDDLCSERNRDDGLGRDDLEVDITPVKDVDEKQARSRVKRLKLLDLRPPRYPSNGPDDIFTQFLCHRAYRIDDETGLVNLLPQLLQPFLERNEFLRVWYIGTVLPLLRLQFEYYPGDGSQEMGLARFEQLDASETVDFLMRNASRTDASEESEVARDIKGLVGPWMYGSSGRKRRKLSHQPDREDINGDGGSARLTTAQEVNHNWGYMYRWMVLQAQEKFPMVTEAVERWDGPGDIDLGGLDAGHSNRYLDEDTQRELEEQYVRAAFACCYAVESNSEQTLRQAHAILVRLARLLDFDPPPALDTEVEALPNIEDSAIQLENAQKSLNLDPETLLDLQHPLTAPRLDSYMLLQMMLYSAYRFSLLDYSISIANVAKLRFSASTDEQLGLLQRVLHGLSRGGARRDESQWVGDRARLVWLWNGSVDGGNDATNSGTGVLGKIPRQQFEEESLKCLVETSCRWPFTCYLSHL